MSNNTSSNPRDRGTDRSSGHSAPTNNDSGGQGAPVLLIHGSGPGVSAWANWRLVIPALAQNARDCARHGGLCHSERPQGFVYSSMDAWVRQAVGLLDALGIERTDLVATQWRRARRWRWPLPTPSACAALVLMGSAGVSFP